MSSVLITSCVTFLYIHTYVEWSCVLLFISTSHDGTYVFFLLLWILVCIRFFLINNGVPTRTVLMAYVMSRRCLQHA